MKQGPPVWLHHLRRSPGDQSTSVQRPKHQSAQHRNYLTNFEDNAEGHRWTHRQGSCYNRSICYSLSIWAIIERNARAAALTSTSLSTPGIFPRSGSTPNGLSSTKSLPQRPARAASPSASKSNRTPSSTLPAKRSASTSPRKPAASVSPSKRAARSRTPSRPAQDLASLFDAIEPTLPQTRNPFTRSESQPNVELHQDGAEASQSEALGFGNSPLPSPTLAATGFDELLSPGALTSPSKRLRMADRMAPRTARTQRPNSTKSQMRSQTRGEDLCEGQRRLLRRYQRARQVPSL